MIRGTKLIVAASIWPIRSRIPYRPRRSNAQGASARLRPARRQEPRTRRTSRRSGSGVSARRDHPRSARRLRRAGRVGPQEVSPARAGTSGRVSLLAVRRAVRATGTDLRAFPIGPVPRGTAGRPTREHPRRALATPAAASRSSRPGHRAPAVRVEREAITRRWSAAGHAAVTLRTEKPCREIVQAALRHGFTPAGPHE